MPKAKRKLDSMLRGGGDRRFTRFPLCHWLMQELKRFTEEVTAKSGGAIKGPINVIDMYDACAPPRRLWEVPVFWRSSRSIWDTSWAENKGVQRRLTN